MALFILHFLQSTNPHSPNSVGILDFHQMHKVQLMLLGKHEFDKLLAVILSKFQFFFIFGNDRNIYGFHFFYGFQYGFCIGYKCLFANNIQSRNHSNHTILNSLEKDSNSVSDLLIPLLSPSCHQQ